MLFKNWDKLLTHINIQRKRTAIQKRNEGNPTVITGIVNPTAYNVELGIVEP